MKFDVPLRNLNLFYGGSFDDIDAVVRSLVPIRQVREVSPLFNRAGDFVIHGELSVFRAVDRSRAQVGRLDLPETYLTPAQTMNVVETAWNKAIRKGRCVLCTTRSEHAVLRVMSLIRSRKFGGFFKPESVSVTVVVRDNARAGDGALRTVQVPITKDGELGGPWPGGFFSERAAELR